MYGKLGTIIDNIFFSLSTLIAEGNLLKYHDVELFLELSVLQHDYSSHMYFLDFTRIMLYWDPAFFTSYSHKTVN